MIKEILIACSNYFPHNFGGTEIYVENYTEFLKKKGNIVYIITSAPSDFFTKENTIYADEVLRVCRYYHRDTMVFGISYVNEITTDLIYSKYENKYISNWKTFIGKQKEFYNLNILHIHSITATIGINLFESVIEQNEGLKTITSYHTPISCTKNTLTFENTLKECNIKPNIKSCTKCILKTQSKFPYFLVASLNNFHLSHSKIPSSLKMNYLVSLEIAAFKHLKRITQEWWCYSDGIEKVLILNDIDKFKINMSRHGIDELFLSQEIKKSFDDVSIYLFSGRMVKIKGIITLLNAWLQIPEQEHKVLWITADPYSENDQINNLIIQARLRKDIVFLGEQTQNNIAKLYILAHFVIIPSESYEIGPLVFHEAIACGCSIIASNIGGNEELSKYYIGSSQLFEAGNENELAAIIQQKFEKINSLNKPLSFSKHFEKMISKSETYHYNKVN